MTNSTLQDQNARDQAVDIFSSCIVSAPAGSGKTGLLTTRVLKLLAKVNEPEEILCITFTRKAAAEMRERIFSSLSDAKAILKDKPLDQVEQILNDLHIDDYEKNRLKLAHAALQNSEQRGWDIFNAGYRLKISTIDGFCKSLSTRLPFLSQMGVESGVLDDTTQAYQEAVDLWLNDKLQQSDPIIDLVHSHFGGNIEQLISMLVALLSVREQWLPFAMLTRSELDSSAAQNSDEGARGEERNRETKADVARQYFESYIHDLISEAIDDAMAALTPYEAEICDLMSFSAKNLQSLDEQHPLAQYYFNNSFSDSFSTSNPQGFDDLANGEIQSLLPILVDFLLTKSNTFRKTLTKKEGFPVGSNKEEKAEITSKKNHFKRIIAELSEYPEAESIIAKLKTLPPKKYRDDQWETLSLIVRALPDLVAYLRIVFSSKNKTDFTEYTLAAVRALDEDGHVDLQQKLDYQIKHILIDEFQDTSQPQLSLLQSLIREWMPDEDKTLFIVGDGMQSCYGFRNANVGLFLGIKKFGLSNLSPKPLELTVNFRSTASIVTWVNTVFSGAFPAEDSVSKGAVHYSSSFAKKQADDESIISCKYFVDEDSLDANAMEAEAIAKSILHSRKEQPTKSIAILAKNRATFKPAIAALKEHNIPFEAVDIDSLSSKKAIQDIHCLTRVCFDISDRIAWISLLRAPFVGLSFADLHQLCSGNEDLETSSSHKNTTNLWSNIKNHNDITLLSSDGKSAINRLVNVFQQYDDHRFRSPISKQVERLWLLLGGAQTLSSKSDLNDIKTYLSTLKSIERAGSIDDWQEFEQCLDKLYAKPETFQSSDNPVKIMTMHKSKGLEFDRVFLPGLQKSGRPDEKALLYWLEKTNQNQDIQFLLSPLSSIEEESNPLSDFIVKEKKRKTELEEVRLFYVACTRAKEHLHLSAVLKENDKGEVKPPAKNSLLSKVWEHLSDEFVKSIEGTVKDNMDTVCNSSHSGSQKSPATKIREPYILRLPLHWKNLAETHNAEQTQDPEEPSGLLSDNSVDAEPGKSSLLFDNSQLDVFSEFEDSNKIERETGSLLHRVLHRITQDSVSAWDAQRVTLAVPFWINQLLQAGLSHKHATRSANSLEVTINELLIDTKAQWILSSTHEESASEFALSWEGRQWIIDRTFVVENSYQADSENLSQGNTTTGTRWIIDYKNAKPNNETVHSNKDIGGPIDSDSAFFDAQKTQYKPQLLGYKDILKAYDESRNKIYNYRIALYFPQLKAFCEY